MNQKVSSQKRHKYDASYKEEVLKMVLNGRAVPKTVQSLAVGENLIYKWKSRSNQPSTNTTATTTTT